MKCRYILFFLFLLLFVTTNSYAQHNPQASSIVRVSLVKGIQVNQISGNLDFGEIIQPTTQTTIRKSPDNGVVFLLNSHLNKNVSVQYSSSTLSNSGWVNGYGGSTASLTFNPEVVHTGSNSVFQNPIEIISGNSYTPPTSAGIASMNIWVGGSIEIIPNQPQGDYSGTFTITLTY